MRVYHRRGCPIGKVQKRVARAKPLPGDVGVSPTTKYPLLLARGMRLSRPWFDPDRLESAPSRPTEVPNGDSAGPVHGHG